MALSKQGRYVYCYECGSRQEMNGVCRICEHADDPLLPGIVSDLTGLTQSEAQAKLNGPESQLILGNVTTEHSGSMPVDKVIMSFPDSGTRLNVGDSVDILISLGPA